MKLFLGLSGLALCALTIGGCMPVASPAVGIIYTEVQYGDLATTNTNTSKEGKACAQSILGWVATGDASIDAAKKAGGITEVAHVDHSAKNILGIVGTWCTIVKGK